MICLLTFYTKNEMKMMCCRKLHNHRYLNTNCFRLVSRLSTLGSRSPSFSYHKNSGPGSDLSTTFLVDRAITHLNHKSQHHYQQLQALIPHFTPDAASYLLLKSQSDINLTLNFLSWARSSSSPFFDSQCKCYALHTLTKFKLYKTARSLAQDLAVESATNDATGAWVFHCLRDSYHLFDSTSSAVFDLMVKTYSGLSMLQKALNTINFAKSYGFTLGILSYNSAIDAVIRSSCAQGQGSYKVQEPHPLLLAEELFSEMRKGGVSPNVFTYNILIRGCCLVGELHKCHSFMAEMERYGCLPNVVTFNTLMDAYCKVGRTDDALEALETMRSTHNLEPNVITYNVLINGFCLEGRMEEAAQAVHQMKCKCLAPDEVTYNTLLNGFCRAGDFHQALVMHSEMLRSGLSPNVITYTALINSMCKAGNLQRAMEFLDQMRMRGLQPNQRTYTTLIDGFSQQGFLNEGYCLLNEMVDCGFAPSIVTYNALIKGHCVLGRMDEAQGIIQEMLGKGLNPDVVTYSTIISGFCRNGNLEKAFQMKQEMLAKGVSSDSVTYSSLIQGLCEQKRLSEACAIFQEMLGMGLLPDEFTYTTLINAYCAEGDIKQAMHLHAEMVQKDFLPDVLTYRILINGLDKQARTREAKRLLLKLFYEESVPNDITYNTLIESCSNTGFKSVVALLKGFCMKGLMSEADGVFDSMLQQNCRPNEAVYNVLVHGHCKGGNTKRACDLYKEMISSGFFPHTLTAIALIKALFKEEMNEELGVVIQSILRSCKLTEGELAKVLVQVNHREGNMDAVFNVLSDMAKDGLLPKSGNIESTPRYKLHGMLQLPTNL
ncbi:hypothetical protein Dimus_001635 [Dionaea muscipula]